MSEGMMRAWLDFLEEERKYLAFLNYMDYLDHLKWLDHLDYLDWLECAVWP